MNCDRPKAAATAPPPIRVPFTAFLKAIPAKDFRNYKHIYEHFLPINFGIKGKCANVPREPLTLNMLHNPLIPHTYCITTNY